MLKSSPARGHVPVKQRRLGVCQMVIVALLDSRRDAEHWRQHVFPLIKVNQVTQSRTAASVHIWVVLLTCQVQMQLKHKIFDVGALINCIFADHRCWKIITVHCLSPKALWENSHCTFSYISWISQFLSIRSHIFAFFKINSGMC